MAEEEEVLDFIAGLSSPSPAGNTSNRRLSHHERESGGKHTNRWNSFLIQVEEGKRGKRGEVTF